VKKADFIRLSVYSVLAVLSGAGAGLVVSLWTQSFWITAIAWLVGSGVPLFFIGRWWMRTTTAAGISTKVEWSRSRVVVTSLFVVTLGAWFGIAYALYATTGNRFLESAVPLVALFPITIFLSRKLAAFIPAPKPQDRSTLRVTFYMQFVLFALFASNLGIQLTHHLNDATLELSRNVIVAGYVTLLPLLILNAFVIRKRLLMSLGTSTERFA
jgi:hypothetical protein